MSNADQKELGNQIQTWLSSPIRDSPEQAISYADLLIAKLQKEMKVSPEAGKTVGPLIGRVKAMQKSLVALEQVNWVAVNNGFLALGHRPSSKLMGDLKLQNCTHLLTLLSESEGAIDISTLAKKHHLQWLWFPMESAKPLDAKKLPELKAFLLGLKENLEQGAKIYLHCSAGIHRTGMISYTILRFLGLNEQDAMYHLKLLRTDTWLGVGDERTSWVDSVIGQLKL